MLTEDDRAQLLDNAEHIDHQPFTLADAAVRLFGES